MIPKLLVLSVHNAGHDLLPRRDGGEVVPWASLKLKWGFPKIMGTFLGVPVIRIVVYWGLYWVPLFWETTKYQPSKSPNTGLWLVGNGATEKKMETTITGYIETTTRIHSFIPS